MMPRGSPPSTCSRPTSASAWRSCRSARSTHELPLEQVLALAATLRDAPPAGTFVGIGGGCFDVGTPLTAPVARALPAFAAAIAAEVAAFTANDALPC